MVAGTAPACLATCNCKVQAISVEHETLRAKGGYPGSILVGTLWQRRIQFLETAKQDMERDKSETFRQYLTGRLASLQTALQLTGREAAMLKDSGKLDTYDQIGERHGVGGAQARNILKSMVRRICRRIERLAANDIGTEDRHLIDWSILDPNVRGVLYRMHIQPKYWEDVAYCGRGLLDIPGCGPEYYRRIMEDVRLHCGNKYA
jgi:hypothetical protein